MILLEHALISDSEVVAPHRGDSITHHFVSLCNKGSTPKPFPGHFVTLKYTLYHNQKKGSKRFVLLHQ